MNAYESWIAAYVARNNEFVRGKCSEAAAEMVAAFPELKRVAGFVHCDWGRDQHFWCVTPDGEVIDPTRAQFRTVFAYEELDLADPAVRRQIPTGRCMECGDDAYEGASFCSREHERSFCLATFGSAPAEEKKP